LIDILNFARNFIATFVNFPAFKISSVRKIVVVPGFTFLFLTSTNIFAAAAIPSPVLQRLIMQSAVYLEQVMQLYHLSKIVESIFWLLSLMVVQPFR